MSSVSERLRMLLLRTFTACAAFPTVAAATSVRSAAPTLDVDLRLFVTLAGTAVAGLLVVRLAPTDSREVVARIRAEPGDSLLVGLLVFLGTGFAMVVYAASVAGFPVAIPAVAAYAAFLLAANVLGTLALGAALVERVAEGNLLAALVTGVGVTWLAGLVPPLGWAVSVLLGLLGVGAFARWFLRSGPEPAVGATDVLDYPRR